MTFRQMDAELLNIVLRRPATYTSMARLQIFVIDLQI